MYNVHLAIAFFVSTKGVFVYSQAMKSWALVEVEAVSLDTSIIEMSVCASHGVSAKTRAALPLLRRMLHAPQTNTPSRASADLNDVEPQSSSVLYDVNLTDVARIGCSLCSQRKLHNNPIFVVTGYTPMDVPVASDLHRRRSRARAARALSSPFPVYTTRALPCIRIFSRVHASVPETFRMPVCRQCLLKRQANKTEDTSLDVMYDVTNAGPVQHDDGRATQTKHSLFVQTPTLLFFDRGPLSLRATDDTGLVLRQQVSREKMMWQMAMRAFQSNRLPLEAPPCQIADLPHSDLDIIQSNDNSVFVDVPRVIGSEEFEPLRLTVTTACASRVVYVTRSASSSTSATLNEDAVSEVHASCLESARILYDLAKVFFTARIPVLSVLQAPGHVFPSHAHALPVFSDGYNLEYNSTVMLYLSWAIQQICKEISAYLNNLDSRNRDLRDPIVALIINMLDWSCSLTNRLLATWEIRQKVYDVCARTITPVNTINAIRMLMQKAIEYDNMSVEHTKDSSWKARLHAMQTNDFHGILEVFGLSPVSCEPRIDVCVDNSLTGLLTSMCDYYEKWLHFEGLQLEWDRISNSTPPILSPCISSLVQNIVATQSSRLTGNESAPSSDIGALTILLEERIIKLENALRQSYTEAARYVTNNAEVFKKGAAVDGSNVIIQTLEAYIGESLDSSNKIPDENQEERLLQNITSGLQQSQSFHALHERFSKDFAQYTQAYKEYEQNVKAFLESLPGSVQQKKFLTQDLGIGSDSVGTDAAMHYGPREREPWQGAWAIAVSETYYNMQGSNSSTRVSSSRHMTGPRHGFGSYRIRAGGLTSLALPNGETCGVGILYNVASCTGRFNLALRREDAYHNVDLFGVAKARGAYETMVSMIFPRAATHAVCEERCPTKNDTNHTTLQCSPYTLVPAPYSPALPTHRISASQGLALVLDKYSVSLFDRLYPFLKCTGEALAERQRWTLCDSIQRRRNLARHTEEGATLCTFDPTSDKSDELLNLVAKSHASTIPDSIFRTQGTEGVTLTISSIRSRCCMFRLDSEATGSNKLTPEFSKVFAFQDASFGSKKDMVPVPPCFYAPNIALYNEPRKRLFETHSNGRSEHNLVELQPSLFEDAYKAIGMQMHEFLLLLNQESCISDLCSSPWVQDSMHVRPFSDGAMLLATVNSTVMTLSKALPRFDLVWKKTCGFVPRYSKIHNILQNESEDTGLSGTRLSRALDIGATGKLSEVGHQLRENRRKLSTESYDMIDACLFHAKRYLEQIFTDSLPPSQNKHVVQTAACLIEDAVTVLKKVSPRYSDDSFVFPLRSANTSESRFTQLKRDFAKNFVNHIEYYQNLSTVFENLAHILIVLYALYCEFDFREKYATSDTWDQKTPLRYVAAYSSTLHTVYEALSEMANVPTTLANTFRVINATLGILDKPPGDWCKLVKRPCKHSNVAYEPSNETRALFDQVHLDVSLYPHAACAVSCSNKVRTQHLESWYERQFGPECAKHAKSNYNAYVVDRVFWCIQDVRRSVGYATLKACAVDDNGTWQDAVVAAYNKKDNSVWVRFASASGITDTADHHISVAHTRKPYLQTLDLDELCRNLSLAFLNGQGPLYPRPDLKHPHWQQIALGGFYLEDVLPISLHQCMQLQSKGENQVRNVPHYVTHALIKKESRVFVFLPSVLQSFVCTRSTALTHTVDQIFNAGPDSSLPNQFADDAAWCNQLYDDTGFVARADMDILHIEKAGLELKNVERALSIVAISLADLQDNSVVGMSWTTYISLLAFVLFEHIVETQHPVVRVSTTIRNATAEEFHALFSNAIVCLQSMLLQDKVRESSIKTYLKIMCPEIFQPISASFTSKAITQMGQDVNRYIPQFEVSSPSLRLTEETSKLQSLFPTGITRHLDVSSFIRQCQFHNFLNVNNVTDPLLRLSVRQKYCVQTLIGEQCILWSHVPASTTRAVYMFWCTILRIQELWPGGNASLERFFNLSNLFNRSKLNVLGFLTFCSTSCRPARTVQCVVLGLACLGASFHVSIFQELYGRVRDPERFKQKAIVQIDNADQSTVPNLRTFKFLIDVLRCIPSTSWDVEFCKDASEFVQRILAHVQTPGASLRQMQTFASGAQRITVILAGLRWALVVKSDDDPAHAKDAYKAFQTATSLPASRNRPRAEFGNIVDLDNVQTPARNVRPRPGGSGHGAPTPFSL